MADIKQIKTPDGTIYDLRDSNLKEATSSETGTVKTNPTESIDLNANGQLTVGGRLGQYPNGGGLYYPTSLEPEGVAANSLLLSEATNLTVGNKRTLALFAGAGLTLKTSAAAGATTYQVSNTFANRFTCAAARGGSATIEEATAGTNIVKITNVYLANDLNKTPLVPYSGATESNNNIVIETATSVNPSASTTKIRIYGTMTYDSSFHCGQGIGTGGVSGKGKLLQLGQSQCALDGNTIMIGNGMFSSKNRASMFGASHINHVQGAFMAGEGHDSTDGTFVGVGAIGRYSLISSDTAFVIGNGTSDTARSNAFEIKSNGDIYERGVKQDISAKAEKVDTDIDSSVITLFESIGWTQPT